MANDFRHQWQVKGRSNATIAKEIFIMLEEMFSYKIDEQLKEPLKFRIFALLNELHIHKFVRPKLQSIPWEVIKDYPRSFLLENCEGIAEFAELVKSYMYGG
jgi:hypothetical protein